MNLASLLYYFNNQHIFFQANLPNCVHFLTNFYVLPNFFLGMVFIFCLYFSVLKNTSCKLLNFFVQIVPEKLVLCQKVLEIAGFYPFPAVPHS